MSQRGKLQTWKIPADKLDNWRRLNPDVAKDEARDCVINSLHYLGVIENPEIAKIWSNYANSTNIINSKGEKIKRGISSPEILRFVFNKFNQETINQKIYHKIGNKSDTDLQKELKNNTYTIALFSRSDNEGKAITGHAVILVKENNSIYVLDTQQETVCKLLFLPAYIKENGYSQVEYLLKSKTPRNRNETTVKLRKNTVSEHTRKRPRIGVNSSNSTSKKENVVQKILSKKKTNSKNSSTSTLTSSSKKENMLENVVQKILPKKKTNSKNSSLSSTKKANMVKKVPKKRKRTQSRHGSNSSSKKDNMSISI
jgi:hypothetical protein